MRANPVLSASTFAPPHREIVSRRTLIGCLLPALPVRRPLPRAMEKESNMKAYTERSHIMSTFTGWKIPIVVPELMWNKRTFWILTEGWQRETGQIYL